MPPSRCTHPYKIEGLACYHQGAVTDADAVWLQLLTGTPPDQRDYAATLADDIEAGLKSVTAAIDSR